MDYKPNIDDSVTIRQWDDMEKEFGLDSNGAIKTDLYFFKNMDSYCGKTFTIKEISPMGIYTIEGGKACFTRDMFEKPKAKLTEWKFAMPVNSTVFDYCVDKLKALGAYKVDIWKSYAHFIWFNAEYPISIGYIFFRDLTCKELTLTDFLALPEPEQKQPPNDLVC